MEPPEFYRAQKGTQEAAAILARRQWRTLGSVDEWSRIASRLVLIVSSAQTGVARRADDYVQAQTGVSADATVVASRFAGVASDGRPIESLLYSPVAHARSLYGSGLTDAQVMDSSLAVLDRIVRTQIADAGRLATQVAITARPRVGWYRYVTPPCCQRCAVLAGKWFKWNQGFRRHPRCDCVHRPAIEGSPPDMTDVIDPSQIHDLTAAQREAVAAGSDLNRVINAYRAAFRSSDRLAMATTTELARNGRVRLTPDGIFSRSKSRDEALDMLRAHGYLR